jgi:phosphocarrier protein HPr
MENEDCPPFIAAMSGEFARECLIVNKKGLHARASAKFVQTVELFNAEVHVTRCGETVNGLSIMGLMMLNAAIGTTVQIKTSGVGAEEALAALIALIESKFGEEE